MKNIQQYIVLLLMAMLLVPQSLQAQEDKKLIIKGVVEDALGPIIGASVVAKNQPGVGAITDLDGRFSLKVGAYDVLQITFVGYQPVEIPVLSIKDKNNLKVTMKEDNQTIDEVVVTASGVQKKKTLTGAITNVELKQLNAPGANLSNSLAGVVPGIIAMQSSGEPGENMSQFWIRGMSTFGAKSGALILVDGVERSFNEIPVEDIESFSVLKDASATAIYGQRGANGVVLITTKRGEKGKVKINVKAGFDWNTPVKVPEYASGYDWARLANEALVGRYENPLYTNEELDIIQHGLDPDLYPNIDWRDLMLKKGAPSYYANISFSGGSDNVRYFVTGRYTGENGRYRTSSSENKYNTNSTYERWNYRANVDMNLTRTTVLSVGVGGWLVNRTSPSSSSGDIWQSFASYTPVTAPRKWSTGQWPIVSGMTTPEYQMTQTGYRTIWENKMETNVGLEQDLSFITKGLKFNGVFAFDTYNKNTIVREKGEELWSAESLRDGNGNLVLKREANAKAMSQAKTVEGDKRYYLQASLDYSRLFAEKHRVGAFAMVYQQETSDVNFAEDDLMASIPHRTLAYSGRFTYAYKDKYLTEFNWGYTGSENFEKGKQFGFFPAVSVGWVLSEEPFIKKMMPWMDQFKIRASYGEVGNDEIAGRRFPYITLVNTDDNAYSFGEFTNNSAQGYRIKTMGTPYLTWEVAKKYDVGVDFSFFNSKITGTIDWFLDKRDDIFMKRNQMPLTTGLADQTPMANVGKMKSYGWDGNIAYTQRIGQVNLQLRANFTYQTTDVIDRDEAANELWYKMEKGFQLNQSRGLIALGLFKDQEDIDRSPSQVALSNKTILPGDIKYKDVNGDGVITDDDKVPLGYRETPGLQYGLGLSANWKNWGINMLFQGTGKCDFFVGGNGPHAFHDGKRGNILQVMVDGNRWIPKEISGTEATEDPNADWPRLTYTNNNNNNRKSTYWLKERKYLRLRNLEITYDLPQMWTRKFLVSNMRIGFIGQNLFTWAPFKWWDPEGTNESGSSYPINRTYSCYIQFSF
ncbi:SusC/RagA family TonB-linked outer membrane protein [Bacteroides caecimuris]|jgi:TonB-linked SusC/RagA family outer membrane protein|uniref:SusC/RagA family protein n=1 Tax=Bacteroides caecimuris TaxID=1796613 RepID=A0A1C7GWZ7_9BACE|nr:TonB-dependent receptor [Bacteroides caecimuris]ANU56311.1 SusC/RagA family protein [Bacteroides caecimuris]OXE63774.1 SusC/RagA family protein [Bacteroides caecimuris]QQR18849.1 TonB-dependent receptor [Bacteroides caecimuris]UQA31876.1 TonB-dependent receptor [Bacteroides caecimuris]